MMKFAFLTLVALLSVALTGCGSSKQDEVRAWMVQERNQAKPAVPPIQSPKQFVPESYSLESATEPFSNLKLAQALKSDSAQSSSNAALIAPELARRKEALEAYPLDAMGLVGSMVKAGDFVALVKVNNLLYQVKPGSYLGLNYGRVTKISETEVTLREIVQDAVGEWIERVATLQLQEKSK